MPRNENDPVTWRDLVALTGEINNLDVRLSRLETSQSFITQKLGKVESEVAKIKWWIVTSIVGSTVLAMLIRILAG